MTQPVPILPGAYYLVTRRTCGRKLRLRPDPEVNRLIEYCFAVGARRYNVGLVALVILSNHWHAILHDRLGNHRLFVQYVDSLIARALNQRQRSQDAFWSTLRNPPVLIPDRDTLLRKLVYVLTNPAAAHLVDRSRQWPGLITLPGELAASRPPVRRPAFFFRAQSDLPDEARLRLVKPVAFGLRSMTCEEFRSTVAGLVVEREREIREQRREEQQKVLGRQAILAQKPFAAPRRREPRRGLAPRVATRDASMRATLLSWFKIFVDEYRQALARLWGQKTKPTFPFGTYLLRLHYNVPCRGLPEDFPIPLVI